MKKVLLSILLLLLTSPFTLAHEPNGHNEEKKETGQQDTSHPTKSEKETDIGKVTKEEVELLLDRSDNKAVTADFKEFPTLHPLVVHFPLVLLIVAVFIQVASLFFYRKELSFVTFGFLLIGFVGAYVAATFVHPHTQGLDEFALKVLTQHELYADLTLWTSGIALVLKTASHFFLKRKLMLEIVVAVIIAGTAYFVSMAGHYGTQLAYIEGIGPQGNFLETDHQH